MAIKKVSFILLASLFIIALSCKKERLGRPADVPAEAVPQEDSLGFYSDKAKNLNVVYFVPNDLDTLAGYESRLSALMLWTQEWFSKEMARNGYQNKTFGLLKNKANTRIKMITVRGQKGKAGYPYNGGAGAMMEEINQYFANHPEEKTGSHILVIIPRYIPKPIGGGPFYGLGKWCFALDYEELDIRNLGTDTHEFTKWFGGMVHELGHGLNLPHNCQKVSENGNLGMALMNAGNYTLGKSATFLTAADAAILNVNEVFNKDNKAYYGPVKDSIEKIYGYYAENEKKIIVSGRFKTDVPVTDILYYNDPNVNNEGIGVNKDYNAVTWASKPINSDSFRVEMPAAEFKYKDGSPYELKVKLVHENGIVTETIYEYEFVNEIPNISLPYTAPGWSIVSFSSQEAAAENGSAANIVDGNPATYWHSEWSKSSAVYPHNIVIDTKKITARKGMVFRHRPGLSRAVKNFEVSVSDDNSLYTSIGAFETKKSAGKQLFDFSPGAPAFRYLKITSKNAWDGGNFAAISEVGLY